MTSRFGYKEPVNIAGFDLISYKSLLAKERIAMTEAKIAAYDVKLQVLEIHKQIKALGLDKDSGAELAEKEGALELLAELERLNNPELQQSQYITKAVVILLRSRLSGKVLKSYAEDLRDYYGINLTKTDLSVYESVRVVDRLEEPITLKVCTLIVDNLTDAAFEELSNFIDAELAGLTLEEYLNKTKEETETPDPKI